MIPVVVVIAIIALVFVASVIVDAPGVSSFELDRRKRTGESTAEQLSKRRQHFGDLVSIQRTVVSLLLVIVAALCVAAWGWVVGCSVAFIIALQYGVLARLPIIHKLAQHWYDRLEPTIVNAVETYPFAAKLIRTITTTPSEMQLGSREELLHLVAQSGMVLSQDEKLLIGHALGFGQRRVDEIMTPRSVIDSVMRGELLNPLVLDQLHKTGHSRLPVINGDIDHIVGILHLRDVLVIDGTKKHTPKVETAMEAKVLYIHEAQNLSHALAAFLRTRHHLFVVVNDYRETVGLLSLEDVIEALIGRKIVDEFDAHDDLRAVAARNPRKNNQSPVGKDVA